MSASDPVEYYARHAEDFFGRTVDLDLSALRNRFLARLPAAPRILDAGCGSGRDTRAFREAGAFVVALEPAEPLACLAEQYTGQPVLRGRIEDLDCTQRYEGVWACASLLHLPQKALAAVLVRLHIALVPGGVLMASFKAEAEPGDSRTFTCFRAADLDLFVRRHTGFDVLEITDEPDLRAPGATWAVALLRKPR